MKMECVEIDETNMIATYISTENLTHIVVDLVPIDDKSKEENKDAD